MQATTKKPTYVTAPSLCDLDNYTKLLRQVWDSGILTHNGPLVRKLESELCRELGVKNMVSAVNGTVALQLPLKAFKLRGEVITTPFSWVATCSSIFWENCTPVFVDIDPLTFNIDPSKIEDAITHKTCAIMPVHVFSNPCDVEAIDTLASQKGLKVIYDAAHAMFVDYKGKSILDYGDVSATSFHATKIFNTGEGGACITTDDDLHEQLKRIRFFGHDDNKVIVEDGCNGKMTEIHAALGLTNLPLMQEVLDYRRSIYNLYLKELKPIDKITFQQIIPESYNYSYMPIVLDSEERLLTIDKKLKAQNVFARRYFYPSLNTVKSIGQYTAMPHSENISSRILCLPSHSQLDLEEAYRIASIVKDCF